MAHLLDLTKRPQHLLPRFVTTAELSTEAGKLARFGSADAQAAANGITPMLRRSGDTRFLRRRAGGNDGLQQVFYLPAVCPLAHRNS